MACCKKGGCGLAKIAWILVIVGGLNWGLVGVGMLFGSSWNLVTLLLGTWPVVEAIVYILVGVSAVVFLFGCSCKKCDECKVSAPTSPEMGAKM